MKWIVLLYSSNGHFESLAVYENGKLIAHKTFIGIRLDVNKVDRN